MSATSLLTSPTSIPRSTKIRREQGVATADFLLVTAVATVRSPVMAKRFVMAMDWGGGGARNQSLEKKFQNPLKTEAGLGDPIESRFCVCLLFFRIGAHFEPPLEML
jgi:hypothetical protein